MNKKIGISGNIIKWIAVITMLIDHIGVTIVMQQYVNTRNEMWYQLYTVARYIGRVAFPLYCFLLVEGFCYTRNWKRYAGRLFAFAVISELPFNLAVNGSWFTTEYTNVLFTMVIGIFVLQGLKWCRENKKSGLALLVLIAGAVVAEICNVDYGYFGIFAIAIFYIFKETPVPALIGATLILCVQSDTEIAALFGAIPLLLYNKERGKQSKYFFYWFYPVHLLVLGVVVKFFM